MITIAIPCLRMEVNMEKKQLKKKQRDTARFLENLKIYAPTPAYIIVATTMRNT